MDIEKALYSGKPGEVTELTVPKFSYVQVHGQGDPNGPAFQQAVQLLYGISYGIKFGRKKAGLTPDYKVYPLEGLWWMESGMFDQSRRDDWRWTAMIRQPDFVTEAEVLEAKRAVYKKKPELAHVEAKYVQWEEGSVVQVLHVGSYAAEKESIDKMDAYREAHGLAFSGKHHEVYLGDPRRSAPEKLRTILRHPFQKVTK